GIEAIKQIRAQEQRAGDTAPRTIIIAISSSVLDYNQSNFAQTGSDDFLGKPFREEQLYELLTQHLGVSFVYADYADTSPTKPTLDTSSPTDLLNRLQRLPSDLTSQLLHVSIIGDIDQALEVLHRIEAQDETLAHELGTLIKAFRLDDV